MKRRISHRRWWVPTGLALAAGLVIASISPAAATPTHASAKAGRAVASDGRRATLSGLPGTTMSALRNARLGRPSHATSISSVRAKAGKPTDPIDVRVLVLATTGDPNPDGVHTVPAGSWDWDLSTLTNALDNLGMPYDTYKSTTKQLCVNGSWKINYSVDPTTSACTSGKVTAWANGVEQAVLWDGGVHAYYDGVMQTNGTLSYLDGNGVFQSSALSATEWAALWAFEAQFGTRTVSANTYPTSDFGMTYLGEDGNPSTATYTSAGAAAFPYINASGSLPITNAWTYRASVTAGDTSTTPLMTDASGDVLAVIHTYTAQGSRQALALTFDSAGYLTHGQVLGYGLVNWVTKGLFLGERHAYLDPQTDDIFIADSVWQTTTPCGTAPDSPTLPEYRITGSDLNSLLAWQTAQQAKPLSKALKLEFPFNGEGTTLAYVQSLGLTTDTLTPVAKKVQASFKWVSHTYSHLNLDYQYVTDAQITTALVNGVWTSTLTTKAFNLINAWDQVVIGTGIPGGDTVATVVNSSTVILSKPMGASASTVSVPNAQVGVTAALATKQLSQNNQVAVNQLKLTTYTRANLIQPDISGLTNPFFLQAAVSFGVKYLISDTSRTGDPATYGVNEGLYNPIQPSILEIARYPVNLYFNVSNPQQWLAEDNCLYPAGAYGHVDTYAALLDRESNTLLKYLLTGANRPLMFHQTNLTAYDGTHSVLSDLMDATMAKYSALVNVPLVSPTEDGLGSRQAARMTYNNAWKNGGLSASIVPGVSITLTAQQAVTVPVTGLKAAPSATVTTESYGGQNISYVKLAAGQTVTLPLG